MTSDNTISVSFDIDVKTYPSYRKDNLLDQTIMEHRVVKSQLSGIITLNKKRIKKGFKVIIYTIKHTKNNYLLL
jgi:hypothetical protein